MSKWQAHKTFGIRRSTIDQWLKLRAETGEVTATTHYRRGPVPALEDGLELRAFIEAHRSNTLEQLSDAWLQKKGQRLSGVTFSNTLRRLGYSRKKRVISTANAVPRHEQTLPKSLPG
jgi:transposase